MAWPTVVRRHPRRTAVVAVLAVAVAGGVLWFVLQPEKETPVSSNPVVADYQKQLPTLSKKAKDNPKDAQASQDYAVALYATGDVEGARDQYEDHLKVDPDNATTHNNLGNVYRDMKQYDKAVESYKRAIALSPKKAVTYNNLANLYLYTLDQKKLAIQVCQDALQQLSDDQQLRVLLGTAYEQNGDRAQAKAAFEQVIAANPNNVEAAAGLRRVQ